MSVSIRPVTSGAAVAGQITPEDVPSLVDAGFAAIICFRPDGEGGAAQPCFAQVQAAAIAAGLQTAHIPAVPGQMGAAEVAETQRALADLPSPVLAYCASGARAAALIEAASR